jgi:hypothetical protein
MRRAFPSILSRISVAALLTLCQCSFLFDLGSLDRSGRPAEGDDGAIDGLDEDVADDVGVVDDGDDGAEVGPGGGDDSSADAPTDAADLDAAPDATRGCGTTRPRLTAPLNT